jgi:hypothetical protein
MLFAPYQQTFAFSPTRLRSHVPAIAAHYRAHGSFSQKMHYLSIVDVWKNEVMENIRYSHEYQTNGGGMACYQHGTFTFIAGAPDNKLQLVKAVAQ